jgi:GT2 family glycosyltransferase
MRAIVAAKEPSDYVLATGETHSVEDFCREAFAVAGLDYKEFVITDPHFVRPVDITETRGDASARASRAGVEAEDHVHRAREAHGRIRGRRARRPRDGRLTDRPVGPAVLVPAFRRAQATRRALASLYAAGATRVILVDDEGQGEGAALAKEFPGLEVLTTDRALYWTGSIALAARHAFDSGAESVLFFNQDVAVLGPDYFERLAGPRPPGPPRSSAALSCTPTKPISWSAGGRMEFWGGAVVAFHGRKVAALPEAPYAVDWLFGMGTLVPRAVFQRIGLPDGERFPMAWGDTDYSLRAKAAGVPVLLDPGLRLVHEVGGYDARAGGPPSAGLYVSWLRDPRHNLSLDAHREIWRRHGPRGLWPLALGVRVLHLLANYVRIRLLFPGEGREE